MTAISEQVDGSFRFGASEGGFPILSSTGQFLIKDAAPLGISVWTSGDALRRR